MPGSVDAPQPPALRFHASKGKNKSGKLDKQFPVFDWTKVQLRQIPTGERMLSVQDEVPKCHRVS
jgi:hypothetical protein